MTEIMDKINLLMAMVIGVWCVWQIFQQQKQMLMLHVELDKIRMRLELMESK